MKRLVFCFVLVVCALSVKAQVVTDSVVNVREHGDYYLTPTFDDDSCAVTWDIFQWEDWGFMGAWGYTPTIVNKQTIVVHDFFGDHNIIDLAQPHYSDTLLTVMGVATYCPLLYYNPDHTENGRHGYFCIADSNFNIKREAKSIDIPIDIDENVLWRQYYLNYEEFMFDSTINVKDKFYVILDNPKPNDENRYGWSHVIDTIGWVGDKLSTQCRIVSGSGRDTNCFTDPLCRFYTVTTHTYDPRTKIDYSNSDTTWHSIKSHPTNAWGGLNPMNGIPYLYLFPIFTDLDTTAELLYSETMDTTITDTTITDSSSLMNIVDNYTFIFPNPASKEVNVQCSFRMQALELFNEQGQKVNEWKVDSYHYLLNVEDYPKGNYVLKIKTKSGTTTKKVIIQ